MITVTRDRETIQAFIRSMEESIRYFARGRIPEKQVRNMAESEVAQLDFDSDWQMHKGVGYFARKAVDRHLACSEKKSE